MSWFSQDWAGPRWFAEDWYGSVDPAVVTNAYPNRTTAPRKTTVQPIKTVESELTDNNEPVGADLGTQAAYRITIDHPYLDATELAALLAFHATWYRKKITIDHIDGYTYLCLLDVEPLTREISATHSSARLTITGNRTA